MISSISLNNSQKQILLNHAQKLDPNESCAILYGSIHDYKVTVEDIFLTKNIAESPVSFRISNQELMAAYKRAEKNSTEIVAIFHSHPSSEAIPSATDLKFMEINPVVWVIYSGLTEGFKAYTSDKDASEIQIIFS